MGNLMPSSLQDYVTLVTGLPRSGTSMMMRMLEAGGIELLTDQIRKSDVDNPRGYYEFEPVKKTKNDPAWLNGAHGKAVKMVYRLLYDLPAGHQYRVLFMQRRFSEVHASQNTMLRRTKKDLDPLDEARFNELFTKELNRVTGWLKDQPNFTTIDVDYNRILEDPEPQVMAVNRFLGAALDTNAMIRIVDPMLYRQRR